MDKIKILLVDDDKNFRLLIQKYFFTKKKKFTVIGQASNGREAIKKANQLQPDLIIMDVRMPRMNGLEATQKIKDTMPFTVIIILSYYDLQEYRKAAIKSGASFYILKTSMVTDLMPAIHKTFNFTESLKTT